MNLCGLKPNQTGIITEIKLNGAMKRRLNDMGFTIGAAVTMLRTAPCGDPIEFSVFGYKVCLRRSEAEKIYIGEDMKNAKP